MRIVIDLQHYQAGRAPQALASALALVQAEPAHEWWIALCCRYPAAIDTVRVAFSAVLPSERVLSYELPAQGRAWSECAAGPIRDHFLAGLEPNLVLTPSESDTLNTLRSLTAAAAAKPGSEFFFAGRTGENYSDPAFGAAAAGPRPKLAYVSPLPPQHSGIADYSAELIPELARYYDIDLIADLPGIERLSDPRLSGYPLRQPAWFEQHGDRYDRIVYHFGNSNFHRHMFALLRKHPGVVVLHDFFLSGVLDNMENDGDPPLAFLHALYQSHGYSALLEHRKAGRNASIWRYPTNKAVLDQAVGVIVHSEFSRRLARDWYGADSATDWRTIPLLRGRQSHASRAEARARLGLADDDFIICSFGMLGPIKLNTELLDAFLASTLAADARCKLLFVGANEQGLYGAAVAQGIARHPGPSQVRITGFVEAAQYADYLAASDAAVQLRSNTRGETSAAVLDCLLHGIPTIANAHGSTAELADDLLLKISDAFSGAELAGALEGLHGDAGLRATLSHRALAHMQEQHAPQRAGQLAAEAIEHFARHSPRAHYRALLAALAAVPVQAGNLELAEAAAAISFNQPPRAPRQLLVDVSAMVQTDLRTGIQRVVRSILLALIADPPPGYRIEPVYSHGGNRAYQYARAFSAALVGAPRPGLEDAPAELRRGDVFLGLDLFTNGTSQNQGLLESMRARGVHIYFTVFDLLPMLRPDAFPFGTEQYFGDFLTTVTAVSDGIVCISRAVADELVTWIGSRPQTRVAPLKIGYFHLGADIDASAPSTGLPAGAQQVFEAVAARPSFLMVGTVEPRKGHVQALAAFELLWAQGVEVNLVIVGKAGWMVEKLVERMEAHPERGQRLFWLPGVSDEMLLKLYAAAAALLAPSVGEGFGLPLIEAAQHGTPIIARDLAVFREVAGEHAHYFAGSAPEDLALTLNHWLALRLEGQAPVSTGMAWLSWSASAQQLRDNIERQHWYRELPGAAAQP